MRCQNCGWDNQPTATVCTKCGQVLPTSSAATAIPQHSHPAAATQGNDRATMVFRHGQVPTMPQPQPTVADGVQANCPICGYPVMGSDTTCPACGAPLTPPKPAPTAQPSKPKSQPAAHVEQPTVRFRPSDAAAMAQPAPTAQPSKPKPQPATHVEQPTVRFRPSDAAAMAQPKPEPAPNIKQTIVQPTPQPQPTLVALPEAEQPRQPQLIAEGGHWYVEPTGDEHVYVRVSRRMEVQPGDVVMVGGRLFRIEEAQS